MSLVRQALAKAEREAAARAAREKGLPDNLATAGQPWRAPRRRSRAATVVAVALALAAAAGAGYWWSRRSPAAPAAPVAAPTAPAAVAPAPAAAAAAAPIPVAPAPTALAPAAPPTLAPQPAPRPGPVPPARVAVPVAAAGAESLVVRELPLEGGRKLGLGGIAWSELAPLAYLNGRLVGVGESVEGYRVARIERDRVHLEKAGRSLVLLLRAAP